MLTLFASQDVAYLASNKGLDIVGDVTTALRNATFDKKTHTTRPHPIRRHFGTIHV